MTTDEAQQELTDAGYQQVTPVKRDRRYEPYWQRWQGPGGEFDWYEFPHDLPLELVWNVIYESKTNPPQFMAERHDGF